MSFEADELEILGGVRHGLTQGGPVALRIGNTEWPKWETVVAADPAQTATQLHVTLKRAGTSAQTTLTLPTGPQAGSSVSGVLTATPASGRPRQNR